MHGYSFYRDWEYPEGSDTPVRFRTPEGEKYGRRMEKITYASIGVMTFLQLLLLTITAIIGSELFWLYDSILLFFMIVFVAVGNYVYNKMDPNRSKRFVRLKKTYGLSDAQLDKLGKNQMTLCSIQLLSPEQQYLSDEEIRDALLNMAGYFEDNETHEVEAQAAIQSENRISAEEVLDSINSMYDILKEDRKYDHKHG